MARKKGKIKKELIHALISSGKKKVLIQLAEQDERSMSFMLDRILGQFFQEHGIAWEEELNEPEMQEGEVGQYPGGPTEQGSWG